MKKVLGLAAAIITSMSMSANAALFWDAPMVDLSDYGIEAGWLVFMYQDVNSDSVLSTIVFDNTGATWSGTGYSDDIWMTTAYQTTTYDLGGGVIQFNDQIPGGWEDTYGGASVYTVVINSDSWATATQSLIFDGETYTLGTKDPHNYVAPEPANDWQTVIPEPSTMAFFLIGGLAFMIRRRRMRG